MLKKLLPELKINDFKNSYGEYEVKLRPLSQYKKEEIDWLWINRIPKGAINIIEGEGGLGKSTIVTDLLARLSIGAPLPDDDRLRAPINILLASAEDHPGSVIRPRCELHGADLDRIVFWDGSLTLDEEGRGLLREAILQHEIELVVLDPIVSFMGSKMNMNDAVDVRSILGPLAKMARELGCTFVLIRHFNKAHLGQAAHRGAGSVDFRNIARSVLQVIRNHESGQIFLTHEKSNLGPRAKTKQFSIDQGRVIWGAALAVTAEELHSLQPGGGAGASKLDEASEFLIQLLKDGPMASVDVDDAAIEAGISEKTLRRAKANLELRPYRENNRWILPAIKQGGQHAQN